MHVLAGDGEERKVIPFEDRQQALRDIGHAAAHDLLLPCDQATLQFADGHQDQVVVTGYSKTTARVKIPVGDSFVSSNVHLGAFEKLTRDTRA